MAKEYSRVKLFKVVLSKDKQISTELKMGDKVEKLRKILNSYGYDPYSLLWAGFRLEDNKSFMSYNMHKYKENEIIIHWQPKLMG